MTSAAMQADYCDLKIIKTRKVIQVVLEIPQEAGDAFIAAFGLPRSDKNVPVAIARLDLAAKVEKPKGGRLAQRAGIMCSDARFAQFLSESYGYRKDRVVEGLREMCGVQSRADLDHNPQAALKFNKIFDEYNAWLQHG
jgi:hypothetical protein